MSIVKTIAAIPEIRHLDEDDIVTVLLKIHREEVRKIHVKIMKFQEEDPLMQLCDVEREFAELLEKYQGKERLDNPVFNIKVTELKRKQDKAKNKSKDYNVVTISDADCNIKMYLGMLDRAIANRQYYRGMKNKNGAGENIVVKIMEIIKNA